MSNILRHIDVQADEVDCYGHWRGPKADFRAHLIVGHCNVDSCDELASSTVSFGFFTNRGRRQVGVPMGVCAHHEWLLDASRVSVRVSGNLMDRVSPAVSNGEGPSVSHE